MSNKPSRVDIYSALMQRTGFEVIQDNEKAGQLRFLGRCQLERWPFFLPVLHTLLTQASRAGNPWTIDVSKNYFLRDEKVLYSWRFIFQAENIATHYSEIVALINSAPRPARVEVDTVLLPGYKPGQMRGGVNERGKGVASAGSVPLALATKQGRSVR